MTDTESQDNAAIPLQPRVMWTPSNVEKSRMAEFQRLVNSRFNLKLDNYQQLHQWSIDHISSFWELVWEFVGIQYSQPFMQVINESVSMDHIPKWFAGARLNLAENMLKFRDDRVALIATGEAGGERRLTYRQLYAEVEKCAAALRAAGVEVGDRVVAYIPNCIEAVVAMLAVTSIGGLWSSTSPDFGTTSVLDRFVQVKPKVLFSINAVWYNGKVHDHMDKLKSVIDGLHDLTKVVVINFVPESGVDLARLSCGHAYVVVDFFVKL
eukprot:Partr_v1_DN28979_c0_g2_i5_m25361 putative synthetase